MGLPLFWPSMLPFVQPTQRSIADADLSDGAFRVLMVLALFKGKDGWCNPSQSTVGDLLGRTRQSVQRHLKELARLGYIQHRTIVLPDRSKRSDYRILVGMQPPVAGGSNRRLQGMQQTTTVPSNHRLHKAYTAKAEGPDAPPIRLVGEVAAPEPDHEELMAHLNDRAARAARNNQRVAR